MRTVAAARTSSRPACEMQVALLEDDVERGRAVAECLVAAGHRVEWLTLVSQAEAYFAAARPAADLLLLGSRLLGDDGPGRLRRWCAGGVCCPVIVLSADDGEAQGAEPGARGAAADPLRWQQAGASECLAPAFDPSQLLACVDAVAQRRNGAIPAAMHAGTLCFDFGARIARRGDEPISLTAMEWLLLTCLARRPGQICSHAVIEQSLGGEFARQQRAANSVEAIVSHLRRKLDAGLITTHRGLGYQLER